MGISIFQQPRHCFGHIHVDIVGLLPPSQGLRYLFTATVCSTCWPEAIPMMDTTTESYVATLIIHWITRFGLPDLISSERGSVSTSSLWTSIITTLGLQMQKTTAYNPKANGMIKRLHHTFKPNP